MSPEEICHVLKSELGDAIADTVLEACRPFAVVSTDAWPDVARFLREDRRMGFDFLRCISANHEFAVRVVTDRNAPKIPSVADVWPAAEWHEREAFDMMGIEFTDHPDPRRILCPEDWEGFPLRKDYAFPVEYHGIPGTTEHELMSPRH